MDPTEIYSAVMRYATIPVLALVLFLCWVIVSRIMSPEWQQKRRNQQIRKAVAARQALTQARQREADEKKES